jgi:hypothetical protein
MELTDQIIEKLRLRQLSGVRWGCRFNRESADDIYDPTLPEWLLDDAHDGILQWLSRSSASTPRDSEDDPYSRKAGIGDEVIDEVVLTIRDQVVIDDDKYGAKSGDDGRGFVWISRKAEYQGVVPRSKHIDELPVGRDHQNVRR